MPKHIRAAAFAAAFTSLLASGSAIAQDLPGKPVLTLTLAQKLIAACLAAQKTAGYSNVNAVVVDDGGRMIAAARQDGACKACTEIAHNKAITAALYAAPTRAFADMSFGEKRDGLNAALPGAAFVPGLVAFAGGLPVKTANGDVIGAIGVSGASEDQDESCAQAGLDAISESLN